VADPHIWIARWLTVGAAVVLAGLLIIEVLL